MRGGRQGRGEGREDGPRYPRSSSYRPIEPGQLARDLDGGKSGSGRSAGGYDIGADDPGPPTRETYEQRARG
jgi:hypothetical protein